MAGVILAHAGLIPAGQWQGDEYITLSAYRLGGLSHLRDQLLGWSPRPVSELLIFLYGRAVDAWRQELITPVLAGCWGLVALGGLVALPPLGPTAPWRWLILLGLLALLLLVRRPGEMFFWPIGALAYLPTLAGITCTALIVVRGVPARRALCALALLVAAGSTEVGAMFVLAFSALTGLTELAAGWPKGLPARLSRAGGMAWWAAPLLASMVVLALLAQGRGAGTEEMGPGVAGHQLLPSAGLGLRDALAELGRGPAPWLSAWAWLTIAGAGLACCLGRVSVGPAEAVPLLTFVLAALCAVWGSAATAWFHFGMLCCERHATFRGDLLVLAALALAGLAAARNERFWRHVPAATGPALLAAAVLIGSLARLPNLAADYRQLPARIAARRDNLASGYQPVPTMALRMTRRPLVVNDGNLPAAGAFTAAPTNPWFVTGVLRFFSKQQVTIIPPP
jgi:hypothetical protein